jgi:hypothetical protein
MARSVPWTVVRGDGNSNRGMSMTGGQARLRTVEQESQKKEHSR